MSLAGSLDYEAYQYDRNGSRTSLRKREVDGGIPGTPEFRGHDT
jgi:hypothetical protein